MLAPSFQSDYLALCRQVIDRYFRGSESATIVPLDTAGGFSGALIWRVAIENSHFALRCWPPDAPAIERLTGLHRLLEHTSQLGITQIAVPRRTLTGETLICVDNRWWQLESWLPGIADFHARPSRARLQQSMQVLSRWHLAAQQFTPKREEETWFASHHAAPSPGLRERWHAINYWRTVGDKSFRGALAKSVDPELGPRLARIWSQFESAAPGISRKMEGLLEVLVPVQPALRDIWHDHLLFTGDQLTGLIDPSACRTENVTTDLARLLGSLVEDNRPEWDFALGAYQQLRPLSLTELQLLTAFDESGVLLSGITWLDWLLIQKRQFPNRQQVVTRIDKVLRRMSRLPIQP